MYQFATKPQSIWDVQKSAFTLFIQCFSYIWPLGLLLALITMSTAYIEGLIGLEPGMVQQGFRTEILLITLVSRLGYAILQAMVLHRIYKLVVSPTSRMNDSFRFVLKKLPYIYAADLLFYFMIMLGLMLTIKIGGIFSLLTLLLVVLCLFYLPFILFEQKNILDAFISSIRLVWRHFFRTIAVYILPVLLMVLPTSMLMENGQLPSVMTQNITNTIMSLTIGLYLGALTLVQFNNLKLRYSQV